MAALRGIALADIPDEVAAVERLGELRAGQTVIVKVPEDALMSEECIRELRRQVKSCLPDGVKVLICSTDVTFEVLG